MPLAHLRGPGHPDALCDAMAIALVEEYLRRDTDARMRLCVTGGRESVFVDGDILSVADFDPAAVLRRVLTDVDPLLSAEPFVTCDTVHANFLPLHSSFEPWIVYGYATSETPDGLPLAQHAARKFVRALEKARTSENGYLFGSDYDVITDDVRRELSIRIERPASVDRVDGEKLLQQLREQILPDWTLRYLPSGSTTEAGIRRRSGVSGRAGAYDVYSSHIPAHNSGIGYALRHPGNLGSWLAREAAQRLVIAGKGRGVLIVLRWDPLETRPLIVSARNEKGDDLSAHLDHDAFDLSASHERFTRDGVLNDALREIWLEQKNRA